MSEAISIDLRENGINAVSISMLPIKLRRRKEAYLVRWVRYFLIEKRIEIIELEEYLIVGVIIGRLLSISTQPQVSRGS